MGIYWAGKFLDTIRNTQNWKYGSCSTYFKYTFLCKLNESPNNFLWKRWTLTGITCETPLVLIELAWVTTKCYDDRAFSPPSSVYLERKVIKLRTQEFSIQSEVATFQWSCSRHVIKYYLRILFGLAWILACNWPFLNFRFEKRCKKSTFGSIKVPGFKFPRHHNIQR